VGGALDLTEWWVDGESRAAAPAQESGVGDGPRSWMGFGPKICGLQIWARMATFFLKRTSTFFNQNK